MKSFQIDKNAIKGLEFSNNNQLLAVGNTQASYLCSVDNPDERNQLSQKRTKNIFGKLLSGEEYYYKNFPSSAFSFSNDNNYLLVRSSPTSSLFKINSQVVTYVKEFKVKGDRFRHISFYDENEVIYFSSLTWFSGGESIPDSGCENDCRIQDLISNETKWVFSGHTDNPHDEVELVSLSPDKKYMVCIYKTSPYLNVINVKKRQSFKINGLETRHRINCIDFSPDSNYFSLGSTEGNLLLFDLSKFEMLYELELSNSSVIDIAMVSTNKCVSCTDSGHITLWQLPSV